MKEETGSGDRACRVPNMRVSYHQTINRLLARDVERGDLPWVPRALNLCDLHRKQAICVTHQPIYKTQQRINKTLDAMRHHEVPSCPLRGTT